MYQIYKTALSSPIDYAAEELKKYLRMMMPDCGEIPVSYNPKATDGFRLGLMQDLDLDVSDAEDTALDDILYINTTSDGGVIAGDNPRSVLLAVYEYLRRQGCRWLFPGVDGEFIPTVEGLSPVSYRHKPSCRYRGQCNEGSEFQAGMLEAIDFAPKIGMNVFMMEFFIPTSYYRRYYTHLNNEMNRPPEPISNNIILQYKRQCEAELTRRGLQFHDIGHGWTGDPFGLDSSLRKGQGFDDSCVSDEIRQYLAMVDGRRKMFAYPNVTQFCMSNPTARKKVVMAAADYAEKRSDVDYLHLWLGDAINRHCECEECVKKTASDWYVILLNELDAELTRRKLNNRIVFIAYTDTMWAPETEKLNNQDRFTMLFAPISRGYTTSLPDELTPQEVTPFVRNKLNMPDTLEQNFAYLDKWRETWKGSVISYEYHFWRHFYYDIGGTELSRIINKDVKAYLNYKICGIIQDGSQRSFFPTGLCFYTYARTMFDSSLSYEELVEEYFSCAFGDNWKDFYDYLAQLGDVFDFKYLEGEKYTDPERIFYDPERAKKLEAVKEITAKGRALIQAHYNMPNRVQTVSVRLLEFHALYAELLSDVLIAKATGDDEEALRLYEDMKAEVGKYEVYFQNCYDQGLAFYSLDKIVKQKHKPKAAIIY